MSYLVNNQSTDEPIKVFVYRNLNQKCWSVKAMNGVHKNRVIFHAGFVLLHSVQFSVGDGRHRVRTEKRKNVHAGAVGVLVSAAGVKLRYDLSDYDVDFVDAPNSLSTMPTVNEDSPYYHRVTYNPYTMNNFQYVDTMEAVTRKNLRVVLDQRMKAYIYDPDGSVRRSETVGTAEIN